MLDLFSAVLKTNNSVPCKRTLANRVDPDLTPQNAASNQDLPCLSWRLIFYENKIKAVSILVPFRHIHCNCIFRFCSERSGSTLFVMAFDILRYNTPLIT